MKRVVGFCAKLALRAADPFDEKQDFHERARAVNALALHFILVATPESKGQDIWRKI